jgi:hypothetical protein
MAKKTGARQRNLGKHGQAAMEYLMTYGWAILVIVIVLGALLYLGVFTPPTPDICQFAPGFLCLSMKAAYTAPGTSITLTLGNALPSTVYLCSIVCDASQDLKSMTLPPECASSGNVAVLKSGERDNVRFPGAQCTDASGALVEPGQRYMGKLYLFYSQPGDEKYPTDNARVAVADVVATIQP